MLLLAPSGLLLRALSPWATGFVQPPDWATVQDPFGIALVLGLVVKEAPFLVLVLLGSLSQVPADRLMTQGRVLGYGAFKAWFVAVAPLLQRQSRLATVAVLVFGVTNVEMSLALGPTTPPTLSLLVWRWFTDADLAIQSKAYAGALLLLLITGTDLNISSAMGLILLVGVYTDCRVARATAVVQAGRHQPSPNGSAAPPKPPGGCGTQHGSKQPQSGCGDRRRRLLGGARARPPGALHRAAATRYA